MPIKWSALEVAEAMDEVEKLLDQAEPFLAQAEDRAKQATTIAYLPQYLTQSVNRLIDRIEARVVPRYCINTIRKKIPQGAVEAERKAGKSLQLGLEITPCRIRQPDDFMEALNRGLSLGHRHYWHIGEEAGDGQQMEMAQL